MAVHILLDSHAVAPLPSTNTGDAVVRGAAGAVISNVVGKNVVSRVVEIDFVIQQKHLSARNQRAVVPLNSMVSDLSPLTCRSRKGTLHLTWER